MSTYYDSSSAGPSTPAQPSSSSAIPRSSSFRGRSSLGQPSSSSQSALVAPKSVRWGQDVTQGQSSSSGSTTMTTRNQTLGAFSTPVRQSSSSAVSKPSAPATPPPAGQVTQRSASTSTVTASSKVSDKLASVKPSVSSPTASLSAPALRNRLKWNVGALAALAVVPRFSLAKDAYWLSLDLAYSTLGGRSDETLAGVLSWLQWALFLVFLVNSLEAGASLRFQPPPSPQLVKPNGLTPPRRAVQVAASQPGPTTPAASTSPAKASRYDPHSPLKASLEAASRSVSGNFTSSSPSQGSPLNPSYDLRDGQAPRIIAGRRMPSSTPLLSNGGGASPLAAYLARRGVSSSAGGDSLVQNGGDSSFGSDVAADLSTESIEVDRALRALSSSFMRSSSSSFESPARPAQSAVTPTKS